MKHNWACIWKLRYISDNNCHLYIMMIVMMIRIINILGISLLKSLRSAFTHTKKAPFEIWSRYKTNFIRENFLGVFFAGIALKLGIVGPIFLSFNPCPWSFPSVATEDSKQFQCLNIILNNKTGPVFLDINLIMWRTIYPCKKIANIILCEFLLYESWFLFSFFIISYH